MQRIAGMALAGYAAFTLTSSEGNPLARKAETKSEVGVPQAEFPQRVYWGDSHLHTENSGDAFGWGGRLGFAAALAEIGLPEGELPLALSTFNLGVEAGQLAIVAATFAVLAGIAQLTPAALIALRTAAAYAIGITAAYWLFERALMA